MRELLTRSPRPRAVFATNDMQAIGAMVALRELSEELEIETPAVDLSDARLVGRAHVGRATTSLELCTLADDRAGTDLPDDPFVDPHLEHSVQHECDRGRLLTLAEQVVPRLQLPNLVPPARLHDPIGQRPLERLVGEPP